MDAMIFSRSSSFSGSGKSRSCSERKTPDVSLLEAKVLGWSQAQDDDGIKIADDQLCAKWLRSVGWSIHTHLSITHSSLVIITFMVAILYDYCSTQKEHWHRRSRDQWAAADKSCFYGSFIMSIIYVFIQPWFLKECATYKGKEVEENGQQRRLLPDQTTGRRRKATAPVMIWLLLMVPK